MLIMPLLEKKEKIFIIPKKYEEKPKKTKK